MTWMKNWQVSFLALAAIWGCSFWWISVGLSALSPIEVAGGRLMLGALTLLVVCRASGVRLPRGVQTWRHLAVVALLLNSVPFTLFAFGQTHVSSILAGIINATTPLAALAVILIAYPEERPTRDRVVGLIVGFLGVLVVLGAWRGLASGEAIGIAACIGAVACYGVAFPYARRHLTGTTDSALGLAAGQVLLGAAFLLPVLAAQAVLAPPQRGAVTPSAVAGMLALGALGSGLAYVLNFRVIAAAGAATASAVTYLTPVVAVAVGLAFLDERVTANQVLGALIVLAGIAASQGRFRRPAEQGTRVVTSSGR